MKWPIVKWHLHNSHLHIKTLIQESKKNSHGVKTKFYNHEYCWPGFEEASPSRGSVSSAAVISHWFDHKSLFALESVLLAMSYSKSNNFELGLSLHLCLIAETVRVHTWRISVWGIKQQRQHQHTCVNLQFFSSCSASDLAWLLLQANTVSLISTEGTLRWPMMTISSNRNSIPSNPHIALKTTSHELRCTKMH